MIRAIKHIQAIYKHSPVGLWQAWALGVIYGKRRDRKRRKKGAKSIAGRGSVTSKADCTNKPQQKEKSPASDSTLTGFAGNQMNNIYDAGSL